MSYNASVSAENHDQNHDGRGALHRDGFTYLPRFVDTDESAELIEYFGRIHPLWESRHSGDSHARDGQGTRRLTRPVYWLGAWQFACLGYYAEPNYQVDRCLRAEPYPAVMRQILDRLRPTIETHLAPDETFAETSSALINFYGSEMREQPVDVARLRPHRDSEPGPVIMISIGQPARFEFVDRADEVALGVWLRHRSVCILSGAEYKERLYHRVTQVRHGKEPVLTTALDKFTLRRVSVSFRHVPEPFIHDWDELSPTAQNKVRPYVTQLGATSPFYGALTRRMKPSAAVTASASSSDASNPDD